MDDDARVGKETVQSSCRKRWKQISEGIHHQYVAFLLTQGDHTVLVENTFWAIRKWKKRCYYAYSDVLSRYFDALKNQREVGR